MWTGVLLVFLPLLVSSPKQYEILVTLLLNILNIARAVLIVAATRAALAYRYSCAELAFLQVEEREIAYDIALLVTDNAIHTLYGLLGTFSWNTPCFAIKLE